nr:unnamed protein product [Spirometra erinaceieuropaei]
MMEFKEHLNAIFPDIQFTMGEEEEEEEEEEEKEEEEKDNRLAFFDVLVCRKDCGDQKTYLGKRQTRRSLSLLFGYVYRLPNPNENFDCLLPLAFHATADLSFKYHLVADDLNLPDVRSSPPSGPRKFEDFLEAMDVDNGITEAQSIYLPTSNQYHRKPLACVESCVRISS